jgi:hypothetical protein
VAGGTGVIVGEVIEKTEVRRQKEMHGSRSGTSRCFSANLEQHLFHCFKCGRSGNSRHSLPVGRFDLRPKKC